MNTLVNFESALLGLDGQFSVGVNSLVKRIDVLYDSDNREHHLTLTMNLPIVNDGIKTLRTGQEGREYEVTPGTDTIGLVFKKKDGRG